MIYKMSKYSDRLPIYFRIIKIFSYFVFTCLVNILLDTLMLNQQRKKRIVATRKTLLQIPLIHNNYDQNYPNIAWRLIHL